MIDIKTINTARMVNKTVAGLCLLYFSLDPDGKMTAVALMFGGVMLLADAGIDFFTRLINNDSTRKP